MKCHMASYTNQPLKPSRTLLPFVLDFTSLIDVLFGSLLTAIRFKGNTSCLGPAMQVLLSDLEN